MAEWKYKYRNQKQDRVRRRDRSVKGRGYWPMIPGGGRACVRLTDKCRERARYSCWMEMNGAGCICHSMHVHTHAYIRARNTPPTHITAAHSRSITNKPEPPFTRHPLSVGFLREPRGFVWIRCNFKAQVCLACLSTPSSATKCLV